MKKITELKYNDTRLINEDNYQYIVLEIIGDVVDKKKDIHSKYYKLSQKLTHSSKPINKKTILAKYILSRLLRESDKAFEEAQHLAKQLCPSCKKSFSNYENVSEKVH